MEQSEQRLKILARIAELERTEQWDKDVEDDPETIVLMPDKIDYLNEKLSSKIKTYFANIAGTRFFEKLIKNGQFIIDRVNGIENYLAVQGGAIITSNHFNPCDNYAIWRTLKPHMNGRYLYKVIREGNYTNPPSPYGFFMRNSNTLPLSSNTATMKKFLKAVDVLLKRGENILIYPEQAMWWNYRKPRPLKEGAFRLAVNSNVPILPVFITMEDSDVMDGDGFPVQKYILNFLPAIYPDANLNRRDNIARMMQENYDAWVKTYEEFYGAKLVYGEQE